MINKILSNASKPNVILLYLMIQEEFPNRLTVSTHLPRNRLLQLVAETTPSFDDLRQHATIHVCKVGQYMSQRLWGKLRTPLVYWD